jgi:NAD-dependent SIR2 family protein deacetylase
MDWMKALGEELDHQIEEEEERTILSKEIFFQGLQQGRYRRILVLAGAGISVSAGIPDFRSESGIYSKEGSDMFDLQSFMNDPIRLHKFLSRCVPTLLAAQPTPMHRFLRWLSDRNLLLRIYTQNVDGLEIKAGIPEPKVFEIHGNLFKPATCLNCRNPLPEYLGMNLNFLPHALN